MAAETHPIRRWMTSFLGKELSESINVVDDQDQDEIEIINQCDYEIFMEASNNNKNMKHLQISPIGEGKEQTKMPPAAGSYENAVHENVECDHCLMSPIIGFRYKCIQCTNYDLCENCESKHIHSEHMMVRMPTNNCPNVVEAYVTGRSSGRRHGKRSKTSCPFVKNGLSEVIDDDAEPGGSTACGENTTQQSSNKERCHGRKYHRRQQRSNFFSHLYEMMHDLAEGGGPAAAAHVMGEAPSSKPGSFDEETKMNSKSNAKTVENEGNPIAAAAAAAAAHIAAQQANNAASKAAEIAAKISQESLLNASKIMSENMTTASEKQDGEKEATTEKVEAAKASTTSAPQVNNIPSPSLESFVQILNNFSGMFAGMLDQFENSEISSTKSNTCLQKDSLSTNQTPLSSNKSSVSSHLNSLNIEKMSDEENSKEKSPEQEKQEEKANLSASSSKTEVDSLGSESENENDNDSYDDSFVKLNIPKSDQSNSPTSLKSCSDKTSTETLYMSKAVEQKESLISNGSIKETEDKPQPTGNVSENDINNTTSTTDATKKPVEKRAVPVYHADQRINNAVHAMMNMGFSNEGAWLTQLLESVNGNIPQALDLMSVAQRSGNN